MEILALQNLSFRYPDEEHWVLNNLSLSVSEGDFVVLFGPSGSGKSTLLRLIKSEVAPHGESKGQIIFNHRSIAEHTAETLAKEIGMVFQDPENQIVMDRVLEELVFGLENLGFRTDYMRKKVAEMSHFFGLDSLLNRRISELSGGQKQMINLASVLLLEPKVLLLDEPTAQLDPVAAKSFISMLRRMNEELGITVIMAEHRLEDVLPLADLAVILDKGTIVHSGSPRQLSAEIAHEKYQSYLPAATALAMTFSHEQEKMVPLTIKEGQQWLREQTIISKSLKKPEKKKKNGAVLLELKRVDFQYERDNHKVLEQLSLKVYEGECLSIVGGNGTGKSTLLRVLAGFIKPQRGHLKIKGTRSNKKRNEILKVGYLPQNPRLFFLEDTVEKEMEKAVASNKRLDHKTGKQHIDYYLESFHLKALRDHHPYDLSGGEIQKAALICLLLKSPEVLLIDEPTKGLDPMAKQSLIERLKRLNQSGLTIVNVTHDIEFAAQVSSRCALMFQGELTAEGTPDAFFKGNTFYTTAMDRLTRQTGVPEVLTLEEAKQTWRMQNS
ncbi:energy-coupling factor transport system ATP-binding protein [Pullulanibacillus pueri]|uniref:ABC transporter domain-containing protein n=1 Tax=Pullulanibacillus pueri TaxID=1437324 RepID=A0A8J3EJ78_9BACL|nr:ABC transporter ATP-binding protein [Pullulanibacillus pueri]MBM7680064.1 energy-coupling factor transport system ATP-binding protein [Pullulanibacillus pueri]GGH74185.1 hypothetical protein GCM10007096_02160 [Pullulanibacillus pueri]